MNIIYTLQQVRHNGLTALISAATVTMFNASSNHTVYTADLYTLSAFELMVPVRQTAISS
jgi:hypothetical protein